MSVNCSEVRDAFRAGEPPDDPAVLAHVRQCPRCTELFADDGRLGRALGSERTLAHPAPALWAGLEHRLRAETGLRAWLRSRPTPVRVALATAIGALVVILAHGGKHVGLVARTGQEPVAWIAGFAMLSIALVAVALRPLGRAGVSAIRGAALLFGTAALPLLYALTTRADASTDTPFVREAGICFALGVGLAMPFVGVLWLLDRADRLSARGVVMVAGAGGLVANLGLALRCHVDEERHLLLGHAPIALGIGLVLVAVHFLRRGSAR